MGEEASKSHQSLLFFRVGRAYFVSCSIGGRAMKLFGLVVFSALLVITSAQAQSAKPSSEWKTCDDGNWACINFCETKKPGDARCSSDCKWRIQQCLTSTYYPWGADAKNLIGPLAK